MIAQQQREEDETDPEMPGLMTDDSSEDEEDNEADLDFLGFNYTIGQRVDEMKCNDNDVIGIRVEEKNDMQGDAQIQNVQRDNLMNEILETEQKMEHFESELINHRLQMKRIIEESYKKRDEMFKDKVDKIINNIKQFTLEQKLNDETNWNYNSDTPSCDDSENQDRIMAFQQAATENEYDSDVSTFTILNNNPDYIRLHNNIRYDTNGENGKSIYVGRVSEYPDNLDPTATAGACLVQEHGNGTTTSYTNAAIDGNQIDGNVNTDHFCVGLSVF